MTKKRFLFYSFIILILSFPPLLLHAEDLNDYAYQNRFLLKSGTILNNEGKGDCLIYPYYDIRNLDGKKQTTEINIENFGEYGIVAKLRFREWSRGGEVFSKDIWINSKSIWNGKIEISEDGTNAKITSFNDVVWSYDSKNFYTYASLTGGIPFSTRNLRKSLGESALYGYIEVIGEERTSPANINGTIARLSKSEQDCPNTLRGSLTIQRVDEGVSIVYQAVAIGNFSRGQGSLFRSTNSTSPRLDACEDSLDQLEFQLSKWEILGPFSISPINHEKTSLIVTYPTKYFHYSYGRRVNAINNPFEASLETKGESHMATLSEGGDPMMDSILTLPYSVNVIGLYKDYYGNPKGIDNISLPTHSYDSGDVTLTSENTAQPALIEDFEFLQERFMMYRGLPAVGLLLYEYRNSDQLHVSIQPTDFSAVWEASNLESVFIPTAINGPSSGMTGVSYTFTVGGSSSSLGHPIQYLIDWGDGTNTDWLDSGITSASKIWTIGGIFTIHVKARCAFHTGIVSKWSNGFSVTIESVSIPTLLSGPTIGYPNTTYTYSTGGSFSNLGHPVQYFFDWGDTTDSNWLPVGVTTATKLWLNGGEYKVKVRARCATDHSVVSDWSIELTVKIEMISSPNTPMGPDKGFPGQSYTYMTGGAASNIGDPIEYQFDWGDGTFSNWQSQTSASKTWAAGGDFLVRVRARCVTHPTILSNWSSTLRVSIERITTPSTPNGPTSGVPNTIYTYSVGGSTSNLGDPVQYYINWGDGSGSGWLPVGVTSVTKVWGYEGVYIIQVKARCATHTNIESEWSNGLTVEIEGVSVPTAPTGPTLGIINTSYSYSTGGAVSNLGHSLTYQFDWSGNESDLSAWGGSTQSKTWTTAGTYNIRVRARCSQHTSAVSAWSTILTVTIFVAETITTPTTPTGPTLGLINTAYAYSTGGSVSNVGHTVEYQFDWNGDGATDLSAWGASTQSKTWTVAGTYNVRARARCAQHTTAVSGWSTILAVTIFAAETITTPTTPTGPSNGVANTAYSYSTGGSISNVGHTVEYQFDWNGDGATDLSAWGASTQSKTWTTPGIYNVRARARCVTHTGVTSNWSSSLQVTITP